MSATITIDTPFFDIHDTEGLEREAKAAIALGFTAKAAVHPTQVGLDVYAARVADSFAQVVLPTLKQRQPAA